MNNFIDWGYGYPAYSENENINYQPPAQFPIYRYSKAVRTSRPVYFLPPAIAPDEIFTPVSPFCIPNVANRYIISNYGRIYDKYNSKFVPFRLNGLYSKDGSNRSACTLHLSQYTDPFEIDTKDIYLHRAVLMSFMYTPGCEKLEVNHKNGIRTDNRLCNLEWVTSAENMQHAVRTGLVNSKDKERRSIVSNRDAEKVCKMYKDGYDYFQITEKLNIKTDTVIKILNGTLYKDISLKYGIESQYNYIIPKKGIEKICEMIAKGIAISEIAAKTGVDKYQIYEIKERKIYTDISINYDFREAAEGKTFSRTLKDSIVHEICRRLQLGYTPLSISQDMKISVSIIDRIKEGGQYTDISSRYVFPRLVNNTIDDNIVESICKDMMNGKSNIEISKKYNIDKITIAHIRRKETYKYITEKYDFPDANKALRTISDNTIHEICKRLQNGETRTSISRDMNISIAIINSIRSGQGYQDIAQYYTFPNLSPHLSKDKIKEICLMLENHYTTKEIIDKLGVDKHTIYNIKNRKRHIKISKNYKW